MSGGRLVVLDRAGREVKRFPLGSGLATLGSHPRCDIRVMLPSVCAHHATVVVHATQTVVRNVGSGSTLVNGQPVSVAALSHGDLITVGERHLRWEYTQPRATRPHAQPQPQPALYSGGRGGRAGRSRRRGSAAGAPTPRSPAVQLALELHHRASMPASVNTNTNTNANANAAIYKGSADGKQVAIVQPQRRDTTEQNEGNSPRNSSQSKRQRSINNEQHEGEGHEGRKSTPRQSPKASVHGATKASMWIESRKTTPRAAKSNAWSSVRKAPPLREAAMRRAASLTKMYNTPLDQTKQVAIMLMTGHTPKSKVTTNQSRRTPSFLVKKPSPVATPRVNNTLPSGSGDGNTSRRKTGSRKSSGRISGSQSVSILEISDSSPRRSPPSVRSSRISQQSSLKSPLLPTPKKSAMKDPKKSSRKTESIKFDLSNLENYSQASEDVTSKSQDTLSEDELTLHYDTSSAQSSPSPRKSIHSRSSRILEKSLGTSLEKSPVVRSTRSTFTPQSPSPARKSSRGSVIIQKALDSDNESRYSRRSTKTLTDQSFDTTVATAYRTKTLSPRSPRGNLETYSIVDLVSMESNESERSTSVYNSAGSANSSAVAFGTPNNSSGRKTRSTIDRALVDSSTPYVGKVTRKSLGRSRSNPDLSDQRSITGNESQASVQTSSRRSKSMTTPENTLKHISVNSTKISRSSRKHSRINDSDFLLISDNSYVEDESPRSSKKSLAQPSPQQRRSTIKSSPNVQRKSSRKGGDTTPNAVTQTEGMSTPEQRHSPEEVGTPVLSIQSLLDSSQSSLASQTSNKKSRVSVNVKRKTIGTIRSEPKRRRTGSKSKSLGFTARRGLLRLSKDSSDKEEAQPDDKMVTPKSAVKLVQEAVKNKHSTAKKPQSKRSIIDNLDESDIVKQLFNSPVKRKLSQSMTEFSRKQLFDDEEMDTVRRPTRNTVAVTARTPEHSALDHTDVFTPERFVSPIGSPAISPDLTGVKRLFRKNTPNNDLSDIRGVKSLLRSPRTRKSIRNDLTDLHGVKRVFAKSPKNRLSDVAVKGVFTAEPKDDLRRVSGVKSLFRSQKKNKSPRNDLTDVRGVKNLFQRNSPVNDLRRVSGVKRTLRKNSPRNDLRDVRGVKRMFGEEKKKDDLNDVSGVEELFNESITSRDTDKIFDQLLGKPPIKAVYSKSFLKMTSKVPKTRKAKSLHVSYDLITNNVEEWLEQELQKRLHKDNEEKKNRELQNLATDTVEGVTPLRESRVRRSGVTKEVEDGERGRSASIKYSALKLPLEKGSLVDRDSSRSAAGAANSHADGRNRMLPLKKRVLHSTPLKGKHPAAPTVWTVSPIPTPNSRDTSIRSDRQPKEDMKLHRSRRATRQRLVDNVESKPKLTPNKQTRNNKTKEPERSPKIANAKEIENANTTQRSRKRRPSLVITKKTPIMSPKPTRSTRAKLEPVKDTIRQNTRGKKQADKENIQAASNSQAKGKLPKNTRRQNRGKEDNAPPALESKEPIQNTRARNTRGKKLGGDSINPAPKEQEPVKEVHSKSNRGKKIAIEGNDPPVPTPKKTRGRAQAAVQTTPPKESPKNTRTRKTVAEKPKESTPKRTRAKAQNAAVVVSKPSPQLKPSVLTRKSRKTTANVTAENVRDTKRRKVESPEQPKSIPVKVETKRGRKPRNVPENEDNTQTKPDEEPKRTRGRGLKTQESTQSEPLTTRRRRNVADINNTVLPELRGRKRKTTTEPDVPNKIAKKNAGNTGGSEDTGKTNTRNAGRAKAAVVVEARNTRAKRTAAEDKKPPIATRNNKIISAAATSSTTTKTTRKRKTEVETSSAKASTKTTSRWR